jgi:hypothetical protein
VASRRAAIADRAQGAQPLAGTWTPGVNHHQHVRSTGHEHVKDLRKREQLASYLVDLFAGTRDLDVMGLHVVFSDPTIYYVAS